MRGRGRLTFAGLLGMARATTALSGTRDFIWLILGSAQIGMKSLFSKCS
jgi:hypothetical protein